MSLTHITTIRNTLADAVVDALDIGSTDATGDLQIATSTAFSTILANLTFANPAFGTAATGTATANAIVSETNAPASGSAAAFRVRDRNNSEVFRGSVTVTGGGGDLQLSSVGITAGDTVSITSMTYSAST